MAEYTELKQKIKKHEGYRDHIYLDSLSIPTFGYGHMVLPCLLYTSDAADE